MLESVLRFHCSTATGLWYCGRDVSSQAARIASSKWVKGPLARSEAIWQRTRKKLRYALRNGVTFTPVTV